MLIEDIKSIIVEDEPLAARVLFRYTERIGLSNKAVFNNAIDAKAFLELSEIDLIFLDIHLPQIRGLEFLNMLEKDYQVILTTAYSQYAVKGFDNGVVDYLLKPIEYERFELAVNRVVDNLEKVQNIPSESIYVQVGKAKVLILTNELLYIESDRGYLILHFGDQKLIRTKMSFSDILNLLPSYFLRIHKSFIVNLNEVTEINARSVTLSDSNHFNIGRKYLDAYRAVIKEI